MHKNVFGNIISLKNSWKVDDYIQSIGKNRLWKQSQHTQAPAATTTTTPFFREWPLDLP